MDTDISVFDESGAYPVNKSLLACGKDKSVSICVYLRLFYPAYSVVILYFYITPMLIDEFRHIHLRHRFGEIITLGHVATQVA